MPLKRQKGGRKSFLYAVWYEAAGAVFLPHFKVKTVSGMSNYFVFLFVSPHTLLCFIFLSSCSIFRLFPLHLFAILSHIYYYLWKELLVGTPFLVFFNRTLHLASAGLPKHPLLLFFSVSLCSSNDVFRILLCCDVMTHPFWPVMIDCCNPWNYLEFGCLLIRSLVSGTPQQMENSGNKSRTHDNGYILYSSLSSYYGNGLGVYLIPSNQVGLNGTLAPFLQPVLFSVYQN